MVISITLLATLGVIAVVFGIYRLTETRAVVSDRLGEYLGPMRSQTFITDSPARRSEHNQSKTSNFSANIAQELARANLKLTVSEYMLLHLLVSLILFLLGFLVSRQMIGALPFAIIGLFIPRMYVVNCQKKRLNAFNDQLADSMILIANSLRSGYSLLQSFEVVSREAPQPTSEEFSRVVREVSLGLSSEEALNNLVRRINSEDLSLIVTAISVQHETGGNLSRILDSISGTIRQRVRVKGEIRTLTSQQKLTGYIIALMPVGVGLMLYVVNPKYILTLFSLQKVVCMPMIGLPIIAGILIIAGFLIMQKMVEIEV